MLPSIQFYPTQIPQWIKSNDWNSIPTWTPSTTDSPYQYAYTTGSGGNMTLGTITCGNLTAGNTFS